MTSPITSPFTFNSSPTPAWEYGAHGAAVDGQTRKFAPVVVNMIVLSIGVTGIDVALGSSVIVALAVSVTVCVRVIVGVSDGGGVILGVKLAEGVSVTLGVGVTVALGVIVGEGEGVHVSTVAVR